MDRHIDIDTAMINHIRSLGYTVTKDGNDSPQAVPLDDIPQLFRKCMLRDRQAETKYGDAWDCLSDAGLSEIILMKAHRLRNAIDQEDVDTAEDSLVDLVNYAAKLYLELVINNA